MHTAANIFNRHDFTDVLWYIDIANDNCWNGSSISSDTKLYNLAQTDGSEYFSPANSTHATADNYEVSKKYINRKMYGSGQNDTTFRSNIAKQFFPSGTTGEISGFLFLRGELNPSTTPVNQGIQNIYMGGLESRVSFALAGQGKDMWGGVLIYEHSSSNLASSHYTTGQILNGKWRSLGYTLSASGGNLLTIKLYFDGKLVKTATTSINDTDRSLPHSTTRKSVLGGWSGSYGEFTGQYNNWMYFNKELDSTDFKQLHNAFKGRYGL